MAIIILFAGAASIIMGISVFWANPWRLTNQVFAGTALLLAGHSFCINRAIQAGTLFATDHTSSPVPMLRASASLLAFMPWVLGLQIDSIVEKNNGRLKILNQSIPWLLFGVVLAICCNTEWYIPSYSLPTAENRGAVYTLFTFAMISAFAFLTVKSWRAVRQQSGIRRVELQFLVANISVAGILAIALAFLSHYIEVPVLRRIGNILVMIAYVVAALAITHYRVYNLRQVFISLSQLLGITLMLGCGIYLGTEGLSYLLPGGVAYLLSIVVFCSFAFWADRCSRGWLGIDGERGLLKMRSEVIELARNEPDTEAMDMKFVAFLREQCDASHAALLLDQGPLYGSGAIEFSKLRAAHVALCHSGWATPESLLRQRPTTELADLRQFMTEHSLGLMVAAPRGSSSPTLLIVLGTKTNEWPFTYPEVQRLQNVAELMDNILTRSRLTLQAVMRAKMEHLAMISRGLAHDLGNLITPVSSFLVSTDGRFAAGSPECEVHAAAYHSVRVMQDYVREALFFSKELTPQYESVVLDAIFGEVVALTATKAADRGMAVTTSSEYYGKVTADAVLLQRVLVNLVGNAIDASNRGQTVTLSAFSGRAGWICLRVADQGCGIDAENLERVFDPYFTTKRYGDDVRGFGLGLTICQKIVQLHGGTISVNSQLERGTTVIVELPTTQRRESQVAPATVSPVNPATSPAPTL